MTPRIAPIGTEPPITDAQLQAMSRRDRRPLFVRIAVGLLIATVIIVLAIASGLGGRS
jgi:hypothetical protein